LIQIPVVVVVSQKRFGALRDVVREVVYKYLGCGDLRNGFARIKCRDCNHEVLLAFSCKGRYFCPSCHQKRVLMFGEWITEEILYPLPHRQYVFTIRKMLRPYFRFDRKLLGKLSQCAYQSLKEFFRTTLDRPQVVPGAVISIQSFGDLVNFHPHLHCLVTDGCFMPNGWFHVLPEIDIKKLENLFRHGESSVHHNTATDGGGIFNLGTVNLNDESSIHHYDPNDCAGC